MALKGTGFLALWNDIEPARDAEYNLWHTREHVPERVSVPGILSGRRYVADAPPHRYFTLYELASTDALTSAPYRHLVDNPSPWSRTMRPDFRNFLRYACRTIAGVGRGMGGAITTVRFSLTEGAQPLTPEEAHALCESLIKDNPDLTNAHLGEAEAAPGFTIGAAPSVEEKRAGYVLLVEAHDDRALARATTAISAAPLRVRGAGPLQINTYRLIFAVVAADLDDPATPLPPGNPAG